MQMFTRELLDQLDLRLAVSDDVVGDYPIHVRCREHNDKQRGNLAVYRDHLHCFVCGWHLAKPMEALAYLLKSDLAEAVQLAPRYTSASIDGYRERTALESKRDPLPDSLAIIYHDVLLTQRSHRLGWLRARGLSDETLTQFMVGHDGLRFVIPVYDRTGNLIALRFRRDDLYADPSAAKYSGLKGRNGKYLFDERLLIEREPDTVVICEGEFDCMRLWQENIPAITITNGAGMLPTIPGMLKKDFPFIERLIIAGDMDEPGQVACGLAEQAALQAGFEGVLRLFWDEGKDVSEAFQLGSLKAQDFNRW